MSTQAVSSQQRSNPRQVALELLLAIRKEGAFADQLIDRELKRGLLVGPDRGLMAELVYGVLRRQGTLDHILGQLVDQPLGRLEAMVLVLLRLGLYQLVYLDRIPDSAAVNETVNLAKRHLPRASGLVNAVLRNYLRRQDAIPFPDPLVAPAAAIAALHSHPLWLASQWIDQLGPEEADKLAEASSRQPELTIRTNTLSTTREKLLQRLNKAGVTATACNWSPDGIRISGHHVIQEIPGFQEGHFAVQDEASQMASLLLDPRPGERIVDCCAAPGGKATHIAQLMENLGELLAIDVGAKKMHLIEESAQRLGIGIIATLAADMLRPPPLPKSGFDRVLLDAPCSGLGVIRRNPEAKWRLSAEDPKRLAVTQAALLRHAFALVKPGGIMLYSTCSTSNEENEAVVRDFLSQQHDCVLENLGDLFPDWRGLFTSEGMFRAWPHRHGMDGFFAARLRKL